jgi:glycine cleavage system aminomethyltransferase T
MNEASDSLGVITAGAWSPSLDCGIGIIRLDRPIDLDVALRLRTEAGDFQAELCPLPFYDPQKRIPRL